MKSQVSTPVFNTFSNNNKTLFMKLNFYISERFPLNF